MRRRLWPVGLVGRVGLVLFGALVLEVAGSSLVVEQADFLANDEAQAQRVAEELDAAVRVLSVTAAPQRGLVATTLSAPALALVWREAKPAPALGPGGERLAAFRARMIADEPSLATRDLALGVPADGRDDVGGSLRLDDGSVLAFRIAPPRGGGGALYWQIASLVGLSGCVLLVALLVVRTLAAPLKMLVTATDEIGHGPSIRIEEVGPGEVRRVARAFNAMQDRIAKLLGDRTQALAAVSHDLRTPISRLRLRAGFLASDEDRLAFEADLAEMEAMLTALLAYLGGENDPEKPRRVDVVAMIATLVDAAADAGRVAAYDGPDHCALEVRALALKRAIANLVNNAIAYGDAARVGLVATETFVTITIDDDGPGIADDDMANVFEPFWRADASRNRAKGGMGLGLSIARQAILREDGSIALANRPDGGLRVTIMLPRRVETHFVTRETSA